MTNRPADHLRIRTMTRRDVDSAIAWAAAEGWNPGLHDAACFHAADPHGFLIGLLDDEPVATISVVKSGSSFGFLGLYIVKPAYRGHGYGMRLWQAGLAYLAGRVVGLDGVVAQQDNYRRSGFAFAYRDIRYQGSASARVAADPRVARLASFPFPETQDYDQLFYPGDRRAFLKCWIKQPHSAALGIRQAGKLAGYGVIRACRSGFKIGPLFADDPAFAEALFLALQARVPEGAPIYLDTPEPNAAAVALAQRHGMTVVFETARMYKGPAPAVPLARLFGVTTFELG